MRVSAAEFAALKAKTELRKSKREAKRLTIRAIAELLGHPTALDMANRLNRKIERNRAKKPKSQRKTLVESLDTIFSLRIRLRDKRDRGYCPFHVFEKKPIECCFHFLTRAKFSIRWDERNAVGACHGCNLRMEYDPAPFLQWFVKQYGQTALDTLILDGNRIAKFSNDELRSKRTVNRMIIEANGGYHGE